MSATTMHVVSIEQMPRRDFDPHSSWARWKCTCGRRSKLFAFAGHAEIAGESHARAMGGQLWPVPAGVTS